MITNSSPALAVLRALDNINSIPVIRGGEFVPRHNAKVDKETITYEIALPGFTQEDIRVNLAGSSLLVSSDAKSDYSEYVVAQSQIRPFSLSFSVPAGSEVESASLRCGMLIVTVRTRQSSTTIPIT